MTKGTKFIMLFACFCQSLLAYSQLSEADPYKGDAFKAFKQKDYEQALILFSKIIANDSSDFETFYNRGVCYSKLHQYDNAINDYNKVLENDPANYNALLNRGIAFYRMSNNC